MNNLNNPPTMVNSLRVVDTLYLAEKFAISRQDDNTVVIQDFAKGALRDLKMRQGVCDPNAYIVGYAFLTPTTAPASTEGNLYYDSTAHKLKIRGAAGFETVSSA